MTLKDIVQNLSLLIVIIIFFPIIIGGIMNMPVGISYVETESMMPQLDPGDGFILIPGQLVSEYGIGDVITFKAENFPYEYVTHRIVGTTSKGFVTQGDNNTFTDQTGTFFEPYIKEEQIVGKVLELNGSIVRIPFFGKIINGIGDSIRTVSDRFYSFLGLDDVNETIGNIVISIGLLAVLVLISESFSGLKRVGRKVERKKRITSHRQVVLYASFILFLALASSVSIISMSQDNLIDFVATEGNTNARAVHIGDSVGRQLEVGNSGLIPAYAHVNSKSGIIDVDEGTYVLGRGESIMVEYTINSPEINGYYREYITIDIYLGLFPNNVMEKMISVNKYLPIIAMDILALSLSIPLFLILEKELSSTKRKVSRKTTAKNVL